MTAQSSSASSGMAMAARPRVVVLIPTQLKRLRIDRIEHYMRKALADDSIQLDDVVMHFAAVSDEADDFVTQASPSAAVAPAHQVQAPAPAAKRAPSPKRAASPPRHQQHQRQAPAPAANDSWANSNNASNDWNSTPAPAAQQARSAPVAKPAPKPAPAPAAAPAAANDPWGANTSNDWGAPAANDWGASAAANDWGASPAAAAPAPAPVAAAPAPAPAPAAAAPAPSAADPWGASGGDDWGAPSAPPAASAPAADRRSSSRPDSAGASDQWGAAANDNNAGGDQWGSSNNNAGGDQWGSAQNSNNDEWGGSQNGGGSRGAPRGGAAPASGPRGSKFADRLSKAYSGNANRFQNKPSPFSTEKDAWGAAIKGEFPEQPAPVVHASKDVRKEEGHFGGNDSTGSGSGGSNTRSSSRNHDRTASGPGARRGGNRGGDDWNAPAAAGGNDWGASNAGGNDWGASNAGGNDWGASNTGGNDWAAGNAGGNDWAAGNNNSSPVAAAPSPATAALAQVSASPVAGGAGSFDWAADSPPSSATAPAANAANADPWSTSGADAAWPPKDAAPAPAASAPAPKAKARSRSRSKSPAKSGNVHVFLGDLRPDDATKQALADLAFSGTQVQPLEVQIRGPKQRGPLQVCSAKLTFGNADDAGRFAAYVKHASEEGKVALGAQDGRVSVSQKEKEKADAGETKPVVEQKKAEPAPAPAAAGWAAADDQPAVFDWATANTNSGW